MVLTVAILISLLLPWPANLLMVSLGVVLEIGEIVWGRRLARRWRAKTGPEAMIGAPAEVVTPCRPDGSVHVHGELWSAHCEEGADVGDPVRVTAMEGLVLTVVPGRPATASRPPSPGSTP